MEFEIYHQKADKCIPVSVIVPLGDSELRRDFFYSYVLPLIKSNNPFEIIIVKGDGKAPYKRNLGFEKCTQEYVFFCDDDILLPSNYLNDMFSELSNTGNDIGYVYTGYMGIVVFNRSHPMKRNFTVSTHEFNPKSLLNGNYISTMSLIKYKCFIEFDEDLERFQDWDLWLGLLKNGYHGKYVKNTGFMAFYNDNGLTSVDNNPQKSIDYIKEKHKLA